MEMNFGDPLGYGKLFVRRMRLIESENRLYVKAFDATKTDGKVAFREGKLRRTFTLKMCGENLFKRTLVGTILKVEFGIYRHANGATSTYECSHERWAELLAR